MERARVPNTNHTKAISIRVIARYEAISDIDDRIYYVGDRFVPRDDPYKPELYQNQNTR